MAFDVSIVPCKTYEPADCRAAMEAVLAPIGGLDWVKPGMKIAVKLNLVSAMKPDAAATTHPELVTALVAMLKERGATVILGDSPGGLYNAVHLNHVYDVCGLRKCEKAGAVLNQNFEQKTVDDPDAVQARTFQYTAWLDDVDAIIDFCKLKTHGMMGMTAAVKNFFGVIPGTLKPEYHCKYPVTEDFADMLVDLCQHFRPRLSICDAVYGMEGNGPTQGTPRFIGALIASPDPYALDLVCGKILGYTSAEIPTLVAARKRGLAASSPDFLSISGEVEDFVVPDIQKTPAQKTVFFSTGRKDILGKIADGFLSRVLKPFPKLSARDCIGCKKCANICPAKAISMEKGKPVIDRKACIHCFCCQEFCPKGAMRVGRTAIARLLNK